MQPFRIIPEAGAEHFKTYSIRVQLRPATCEEVGCDHWRDGWVSVVPAGSTHEGLIRQSGRQFTEHRGVLPAEIAERLPDSSRGASGDLGPGLIAFYFPPGQQCFQVSQHRTRLDTPELYLVRGGDWRGDPRRERPRTHSGADAWVDDFGTHQDRLKRTLEGGPS